MMKTNGLKKVCSSCAWIVVSLVMGSLAHAEEHGKVILNKDAVDASAGNLPSYKIETPTATYYLEKKGAGLSSLIDKDGNDWIGFHPEPGSGAGGEYRGFPNAVYREAGNYFHPENESTDPSKTQVERQDPHHVTITASSEQGHWACRYDFYPTHCTFTMTKMPSGHKYWVLYEGTPGGSYDDADWWLTSGTDSARPLTQKYDDDLPAPEWIAFGDAEIDRALFLRHHEDDDHPDKFYQMNKKMTVFGFGRSGLTKFLDSVPQQFTIGLIDAKDKDTIRRAIQRRIAEEREE